jgi:hypothetical protein
MTDTNSMNEGSGEKSLEAVSQLILVSPTTGHRLEVQSELRTEGACAVFQVGNRRESFEVRITMREICPDKEANNE